MISWQTTLTKPTKKTSKYFQKKKQKIRESEIGPLKGDDHGHEMVLVKQSDVIVKRDFKKTMQNMIDNLQGAIKSHGR